MTRDLSTYVLWTVALAVLLAGAILSISTITSAGELRARLARKLRDAQRLEELAARLKPFEQARKTYSDAAQEGGTPPDLARLFREDAAAADPDDIVEGQEDLPDGWVRMRRTLVFNRGAIADAMRAVCAAENLRPPWRLAKVDVRAVSPDGSLAEVSATLETLARR